MKKKLEWREKRKAAKDKRRQKTEVAEKEKRMYYHFKMLKWHCRYLTLFFVSTAEEVEDDESVSDEEVEDDESVNDEEMADSSNDEEYAVSMLFLSLIVFVFLDSFTVLIFFHQVEKLADVDSDVENEDDMNEEK